MRCRGLAFRRFSYQCSLIRFSTEIFCKLLRPGNESLPNDHCG
jgi:hypothetical protein